MSIRKSILILNQYFIIVLFIFFNYYYAFLFVFAGKVEGPEGTSDGAVSICQDVDFVFSFFLARFAVTFWNR